jgi:hypothetical protein
MWRIILTLIFSLYLCGCSTVGVDKVIRTEDGSIKLTKVRIMPEKDRDVARKSIFLISKIDPNQVYPYLPASLYWASLGEKYSGLTVTYGLDPKNQHKCIYLDRDTILLDYKDPLEWLHFGAVLSHELNHYFYDTEDPYTGKITNETIYRKLADDPTLGKKFEGWWKEVIKSH